MVAVAKENNLQDEILRERVRANLKHLEKLGISSLTRDLLELAHREYKLLINDTKIRSYRQRISTNQNAARRDYTGRVASEDQKIAAKERAEEFQRDLKSHHPSFAKPMLKSHVSGGFWLGLPKKFCDVHLPPSDIRMILEDEKGMEFDTLYLGRKSGLSGGWRGFAMAHNLEDGDVLVFELSAPTRFKVYITKAIEGDPSETETKKATNGTKTGTKKAKSAVPKKNLPSSQEQPPNSGSVKKVQRGTKRKHKP